ncbi:MAG: FAD:protein FMN transferase [Candidatus Omnitrophica bacterium]|nr:FAD:protein FMN transferase [Candidatus Omnitrophota bacterium]
MGTFAKITCIGKNKESCSVAIDKAFEEIGRVENLLSKFKESSEISILNNSGTEPVKIGAETLQILKKAKQFYEASGGAFDISVSPLLKLWCFYDKNKTIAELYDRDIKEKLNLIGLEKIIIDDNKHTASFKFPGMALDLGGIAKGYAVDKARDVMLNLGVKNALISIGGEIFCIGKGIGKNSWNIGIRHPLEHDKIIATVNLKNKAVSTSGAYENFIEIKGKRFGHIINPRTGYPVENNLVSVTIIADDCTTADALATAVFVLGKEKGLVLIKEYKVEAVLISKDKDGLLNIAVTKNLRKNLKEYNSR